MSMQLLTFKTPTGYKKAKPITECLRYIFDFKNLVIFGLFHFQQKFEKLIVL